MEIVEHPVVNINNLSQTGQVNIAGVNNITMSKPLNKIQKN